MKHKVNVLTTTTDLAVRDAEKFEPFFRALGLSVMHNTNVQDKAEIPSDPEVKFSKADIVFGTASSFIHQYLNFQIGNNNEDRALDTLIGDEFDSPLLDEYKEYIIACDNPLFIEEIIREVKTYVETQDTDGPLLKQHLKNKFGFNFPVYLVNDWMNSAIQATKLQEGISYVIQEGKIVPVNYKDTGELSHSCRWSNFQHCFLELKHGIKLQTDTLSQASMSFVYYLNRYKKIYGVSGTLGDFSERKQMRASLRMDTHDSPSHFSSKLIKDPVGHIIVQDEKYMEILRANVKRIIAQGRPVHIVCETIEKSKQLFEVLQNLSSSVHVYNDVQSQHASAVLAEAGKPGSITITTNIGGRGSDIIISPEVAKKGGLHVISTYLPETKRVEEQNFGRAGRQGQDGSFQYIVEEKEFYKFRIQRGEKSNDEMFRELDEVRKIRSEITQNNKTYKTEIDTIRYKAQDVYFNLTSPLKKDLSDVWKQTYAEILRITDQYGNAKPNEENIRKASNEVNKIINSFLSENDLPCSKEIIEEEKKSKLHTSKSVELFVADMDETCLAIHTHGIALFSDEKELNPLIGNFKNPDELKKFFQELHNKKIPIAIATFGTEIEFVSADGAVLPKLFASGKESIEKHFEALLGSESKEIIASIQAYLVENRKITSKITYKVSQSQYESLKSRIDDMRKKIIDLNKKVWTNDDLRLASIQEVYDTLQEELSQLRAPSFEEKKSDANKVLPFGKNPHLAHIKSDLGITVDNDQIIFADDDYSNRVLAENAGYSVLQNVSKIDKLKWTTKVMGKFQRSDLNDISRPLSLSY